ncbi:MAG: hypothetical protein GY920_17655 [Aliivibrio sp.]|nr:hypothetical protein [Aliivibrio sp.]
MSSPFALKFLGKKPFTKKTANPEAGGKDYEAIGDAARKREQKLSAETGGVDYEAKLKVQKEMSPLKGAYSSGAGGSVYVSTAGAFQNLQNKISAGIQADLANRKAKAAAEAKAAKKSAKKKKKFQKESSKVSDDVKKFESFTFDTSNMLNYDPSKGLDQYN